MKFAKSDFSLIKWSLLIFLLVLGAGSAIIMASESFIEKAQRDQREAKRQLNEARTRLATAGADRENMQTYMLEYDSLLKHNIIGNDQRLDWVEGLDRIHKQNQALGSMDFKYSIAPQKTYAPAPPLDSGNFELNQSDMTLQFDLLHEEQLLAFFDILRADVNGWFLLDHCALERSGTASLATDTDIAARGPAPQLRAECAGGWFTMKNRNAPK